MALDTLKMPMDHAEKVVRMFWRNPLQKDNCMPILKTRQFPYQTEADKEENKLQSAAKPLLFQQHALSDN